MKLKEIDLYITEKCNLKCEFCSICAGYGNQEELPYETIVSVVDQAKKLGVEDIHITGGEPLLHPRLTDVIRYINDTGVDTRLITNGTLLTHNKLYELEQAGLKNIMLSVDGLEAFHDSVRGKGNYKKTINTIRTAVKLNMNVRVNAVAWNENLKDLVALGKFLEAEGVSVYSVFLGSPVGRGENIRQLSVINAENWRTFLEKIKEIFEKSQMRVVVEKGYIFNDNDIFDPDELRSCHNIINNLDYLSIRANGNIYPCVFFSNSSNHIGNITVDSLEVIQDRIRKSDFYRNISAIPEECNECANVQICKGGCKGFSNVANSFDMDTRCLNSKKYIPVCPLIKLSISEGRLAACTDDLL